MIIGVFKHALMITSFVLIMMLLIEYINVQTRGSWQQKLKKFTLTRNLLAFIFALLISFATVQTLQLLS